MIRKDKQPQKREYNELLEYIHRYIGVMYGSVSAFTRHEDFTKKVGFDESDAHAVSCVLSLPKDGSDKTVKSTPKLAQLYAGLLGVEVVSKREVIHNTVYMTKGELPPLPEPEK
jgi:hypothetical protein